MSSDPNLPSDPNPLPPVGTPGSPLSTEPAAVSTSGLAPNVAAGICAIFTLLGGIIFILVEKRNQFVRFWAMQSIFFGAAWFAFGILSAIIGAILGHILGLLAILWSLVSLVITLGLLVLWVVTVVQAFSGKAWEIPVIGKLARQQLAKTPML